MEADEKQSVLAELASGQEVLLSALREITGDAAVRRPAPDRWSVLECVEHLVVSEDYLFSQMVASHHSDRPIVNDRREALILSRGLDRTVKVPSPEVGRPTGRFSTLAEATERFLASRKRTIDFVEGCDDDLRSKLTTHPIVGIVSCYETLLMMAVHPRRHALQVEEIKAALV